MGKPAARLTDSHTCPMATPAVSPIPHIVSLIIVPAEPTVLIGSLPAAIVGNSLACVCPPDSIINGSSTVLLGGKLVARIGNATAHGGFISMGLQTVLIGD